MRHHELFGSCLSAETPADVVRTGGGAGMSAHALMDHHERMRLRAAAFRATRVYPGPVGELISRELLSWEEFGYRLGSLGMIMGIVDAVMNAQVPQPEAA